MYIYMLKVILPGETEECIKEFAAPDLFTAFQMAGQRWRGIHVVEYMGSYLPGMKGEA